MAVTLQKLIDETADYVKVDMDDDDSAVYESRFISALNEAKNIIAQRFAMTASEDVTLDENSCFDAADLSNSFWGLRSINGGAVRSETQNGLVWCSAAPESTVTVEYDYIPDDMEAVTDTCPFPEAVSWRLLCYYAAARFYEIKGTATSLNKYNYWMNAFESGVNALRGGGMNKRRRVRAVYNMEG